MTTRPGLSKSRFIAGSQCHLRLWYESYARELAAAPDESLQAVFDTGHEVGEMACRRYPGGHLVAHDHRHVPQAVAETCRVIDAGSVPALFEAAFEHAHVLERLPDGGWRLIEVKSTTRLKEVFILDVAVQLWVLRGAGVDVRDAGVMTLNREYVYDGVRLDLHALFDLHPVFDEACALLDTVGAQVREMQTMLAQPTAPDIAPGDHCFIPYECPFHAHCTRDQFVPDHGIGELPRLTAQRRIQLVAAGIEEIGDVPADFPLTALQRIVRRSVREGRALTVQRELARLTSSGLVNVSFVGKRKHYQANHQSPVFEELCSLIVKTVAVLQPVRQALEPLADRISLALVYGSVAT